MATAESYIGSLLSLTSKSEIRYEGVLFAIDTVNSTIGLQKVRSFGTEGRKMNGPQVPAGDKIYDYILFRGSDIKDLQVKSSPSVQPTPMHNDPAIIQSHYPHVASESPTVPPIGSGNVANLSSNTAQLGLPSSTFQSNLPPYQPMGNLNSWGSAPPPPSAGGSGLPMPMYWPGYYAHSGGIPQIGQPSLLQPPPGLPIHHSAQMPLQYPGTNLAVSSGSPNLPGFTASLHPPASNIPSSNSTPLQSASTATQASAVAPPTSDDLMPSKPPPTSLPASVPGANLASVPPSTSTSNSIVHKSQSMNSVSRGSSRSVSAPIMAYRPVSRSIPSAVGTSSSSQIETSVALITPGQLLQPGPTETTTRTTLPDPSVLTSNTAKGPILPLPKPTVQKFQFQTNGASPMRQHNVAPARGRGNQTYRASHMHAYNRSPGGGHEANGGSLIHPHSRGPGRRGNMMNGGPQMHHYNRGPGRGRGNEYPGPMTTFTEDFDFAAMNEKFKKDEVWGELGNMKAQASNNEGEAKDAGRGELKQNGARAPEIDVKPFYCKDDFFDSLSCTTLNNGSQNGRGARFSEQVKLDTETFGELQQHRFGGQGAPAYRGSSRGRDFQHGRGQGYIGRGRGHGNAMVYRPRGDS